MKIKLLIFVFMVAASGAAAYLYLKEDSWSKTEVLDGYNAQAEEEKYQEEIKKNPPPVATASTGLNPAHGQPGHRCDIPVGASLSTPVKTAADNSILNTAPSVKLNPAHGQPGHRCDLAVGAVLP